MQPTRSARTGAVDSLQEVMVGPPDDGLRFADRHDAGRRLAALLDRFRDQDPVVVGIPRGGVPVAAEVARALGAPLDVAVVRKIGAPGQPEYAIGALAEGGVRVLERRGASCDRDRRRRARRARRPPAARAGRAPAPLPRRPTAAADVRGRTVLLVDDGLATGRSARAAAQSLRAPRRRAHRPRRPRRRAELAAGAARLRRRDRVRRDAGRPAGHRPLVPGLPPDVRRGGHRAARAHRAVGAPRSTREVAIDAGPHLLLAGDLTLPTEPRGVVAFAHGSGSSRLSPRNRAVAAALNRAGIATLLFDLLTPAEETDRANVFDIALLARPAAGRDALAARAARDARPAARLLRREHGRGRRAGGRRRAPARRSAPSSRAAGGPTSPARALGRGRAPTLLIVGGDDRQVLELNRQAQRQLRCAKRPRRRPGRHAPLRGARRARRGRAPGHRVVHAPLRRNGERGAWGSPARQRGDRAVTPHGVTRALRVSCC